MTTPRPRPADAGSTGSDTSAASDRQGPARAGEAAGNAGVRSEQPLDEWVTGDEPMTGPQRSYLQTLAREAGEELPDEEMTKAAASELIARLQRATGRIPADRPR